jgi:hypothetical protein
MKMKPITVLTLALVASFSALTPARADTKLLFRTPTSGFTVVPNQQSKLVPVGTVDVSAYSRLRVIVVSRRPTNIPLTSGFGAPYTIELRIAEGNNDLGLLENGFLSLNPTGTDANAPAHTESLTTVLNNPVITTMVIDAVGPIANLQQTTVDIFVYGDTCPVTVGP